LLNARRNETSVMRLLPYPEAAGATNTQQTWR